MTTPLPIAWHLTARLCHDRLLASSPAEYRKLAAIVLEHARPRQGFDCQLVAFSMPDSHLHLLVACGRRTASRFVRCLEGALVRRMPLPVSFERARFTPVRSQRHLVSSFDYVLRQHERHESRSDPCREATSLPDLLGLRLAGRFTLDNARRWIPRLDGRQMVRHFGVTELPQGRNPALLAEAAAAVALAPALTGLTPGVVLARRAAVHWATERGLRCPEIGRLLSITERGVRGTRATPVTSEYLRAIGLQIGLREQLGEIKPS